MYITKDDLDIPISTFVQWATNHETPRQFIRNSEMEFGINPMNLDDMVEEDLNDYFDFLDYLWEK